jgi:hypothetical protein
MRLPVEGQQGNEAAGKNPAPGPVTLILKDKDLTSIG